MKARKQWQKPKSKVIMPGRNEEWAKARLMHSNRNLTVPSGKAYKRPKAGARGRDW